MFQNSTKEAPRCPHETAIISGIPQNRPRHIQLIIMQWYFKFVTYHEKPGLSNMQLLGLLRHERIKEKDRSKNIEE